MDDLAAHDHPHPWPEVADVYAQAGVLALLGEAEVSIEQVHAAQVDRDARAALEVFKRPDARDERLPAVDSLGVLLYGARSAGRKNG